MASFMQKALVYLGIADDEEDYEDYEKYRGFDPDEEEEYEPESPRAERRPSPRPVQAVRPIRPSEEQKAKTRRERRPESHGQRTINVKSDPPPIIQPVTSPAQAKPFIVAPVRYGDAQKIGDHLRSEKPVIVNLQDVDKDLARRMIDFCAGLVYALHGSMERVAENVFLLTPTNVDISDEDRRKITTPGVFNRR